MKDGFQGKTAIVAAAVGGEVASRGVAGPAQEPVLESRELFACSRVVRIRHGSEEYRLQLTRNGKLILIK